MNKSPITGLSWIGHISSSSPASCMIPESEDRWLYDMIYLSDISTRGRSKNTPTHHPFLLWFVTCPSLQCNHFSGREGSVFYGCHWKTQGSKWPDIDRFKAPWRRKGQQREREKNWTRGKTDSSTAVYLHCICRKKLRNPFSLIFSWGSHNEKRIMDVVNYCQMVPGFKRGKANWSLKASRLWALQPLQKWLS